MKTYLSKTDFAMARACPTKLGYKKLGYPSLSDDDPYLDFLRDGGYMVETLAELCHPEGREMEALADPEEAFAQTRRTLETGDATLFQATVVHGNLLVLADILRRQDRTLRLIEVKSSSFDSVTDGAPPFRGKKGGIKADWLPYLEDVTFQAIVVQRAFPDFHIVPCLCLVDTAKTAGATCTLDKFQVQPDEGSGGRRQPRVEYLGDKSLVPSDHVLGFLDVSAEVRELEAEIAAAADALAATLQTAPITRVAPALGKKCRKCEYRLPPDTAPRSGFRECWGPLADANPHLLDLYRVDLLGGRDTDLVAELAKSGKARLSDVPADDLSGTTASRQRLQLDCTAQDREFMDPALKRILAGHEYPLHFIDFEASRLAVPYHGGMRPYEQAAFQWSCLTIRAPGAAIEHAEWLNSADVFPNFEFARTLRGQLGDHGTVYIWSPYERTTLREIRRQLDRYAKPDASLAGWLDQITRNDASRLVDLCELARLHYFHPAMKGSLSIKDVLPAVWASDERLRAKPVFAKYLGRTGAGAILNPYDTLPPLPIGAKEEVVNEGTGAMRVYQEMMFGVARADPAVREAYRRLLLQYCELDTAAMVMIWLHWVETSDSTASSQRMMTTRNPHQAKQISQISSQEGARTSRSVAGTPGRVLRETERQGLGICLSGGGFRAALFHLGALRRLHELGVLARATWISSVSGGSILAGHIADRMVKAGMNQGIAFQAWNKDVSEPFREFVGRDLRTWPFLAHLLWNWFYPQPRVRHLESRYRKRLTALRIGDLPSSPVFILCATDLAFGVNWEFSREAVGDYQAGYLPGASEWPLARAVNASACFPPIFGPMRLPARPSDYARGKYHGDDRDKILARLSLSDGGVYDNMGLEPVWEDARYVLVSDGGAPFEFQVGKNPLSRLLRYTSVLTSQTHALRVRRLVGEWKEEAPCKKQSGTYWRLAGGLDRKARERLPNAVGYSQKLADTVLARIRTDLDAFTDAEKSVLENHGYFSADYKVRRWLPELVSATAPPPKPPYPDWMDETRVEKALRYSHCRIAPVRWLRSLLGR